MNKKEQILEATADLIAIQGIQNCPMAAVAKHAGCAAGTIYRYFKTKEEMILELYLWVSKKLSVYCLEDYPSAANMRTRFDHIWGKFYQFLITSPRNICLLEQLLASPLISVELQQQAMGKIHSEVSELFSQAKNQQRIKSIPDELLTTMTFGSLFNIAKKQHQMPHYFSTEVQPQILLNMCWDAISNHA